MHFLVLAKLYEDNIVAANIIISLLYLCFIELLLLCFYILNAVVLPIVCLNLFLSAADYKQVQ